MKFYVKTADKAEIKGTFTINEIQEKINNKSLSINDLIIEAKGQTVGKLKKSTDWVAIETVLNSDTEEESNNAPLISENAVKKVVIQDSIKNVSNEFKTLIGYGQFISGFGWFILELQQKNGHRVKFMQPFSF